MAEYLSAVDRQRRTLQALGLRRVLKPVESLAEYVARKYPKTHQEE